VPLGEVIESRWGLLAFAQFTPVLVDAAKPAVVDVAGQFADDFGMAARHKRRDDLVERGAANTSSPCSNSCRTSSGETTLPRLIAVSKPCQTDRKMAGGW
jgi:hypothetical protein